MIKIMKLLSIGFNSSLFKLCLKHTTFLANDRQFVKYLSMESVNYDQDSNSWFVIICKSCLFILLTIWTYHLLLDTRPWIFIDGVNLLFHEAGHLIFIFGGQFLSFLGGTITQLGIPFLIGIYFWINKKYFELYFCLFWFGDNLINVSTYIKDAQSQTLDLVGGQVHDWNAILTGLHLLSWDQTIGSTFYFLGLLCLITSIILMLTSIVISVINKLLLNLDE